MPQYNKIAAISLWYFPINIFLGARKYMHKKSKRDMDVKVVTNKSCAAGSTGRQSPSQGNEWEARRAREMPSWMASFGLSRCTGLCSISEQYSLHLDCSVMDVFVQPGNQTVGTGGPHIVIQDEPMHARFGHGNQTLPKIRVRSVCVYI